MKNESIIATLNRHGGKKLELVKTGDHYYLRDPKTKEVLSGQLHSLTDIGRSLRTLGMTRKVNPDHYKTRRGVAVIHRTPRGFKVQGYAEDWPTMREAKSSALRLGFAKYRIIGEPGMHPFSRRAKNPAFGVKLQAQLHSAGRVQSGRWLNFDGHKFTAHGKPKLYGNMTTATLAGRAMLKRHPHLKKYAIRAVGARA